MLNSHYVDIENSILSAATFDTLDFQYKCAPCIVCVPAKNEADNLPGFLTAMRSAFEAIGVGSGALVVALDGDQDDSHDILDAWRSSFPVPINVVSVPAYDTPHAGRVRRAAMDAGALLFPTMPSIICTTDADTRVAPDWLTHTREYMVSAEMVCGDIWRDDLNGNVIRASHERHYHALHQARRIIDPLEYAAPSEHPQGFGASLALRRNVYQAIGGCPNLPSDEDVQMVRAVRAAGLRICQPRDVRVVTSSRRNGRADGGLAAALVAEDAERAMGRAKSLSDPRIFLDRYRIEARLRELFSEDQSTALALLSSLALELDLNPQILVEQWRDAVSPDAFVMAALPELKVPETMSVKQAGLLLRTSMTSLGYGSNWTPTAAKIPTDIRWQS